MCVRLFVLDKITAKNNLVSRLKKEKENPDYQFSASKNCFYFKEYFDVYFLHKNGLKLNYPPISFHFPDHSLHITTTTIFYSVLKVPPENQLKLTSGLFSAKIKKQEYSLLFYPSLISPLL